MVAIDARQPNTPVTDEELDRMVGPDPYRAGRARWRLIEESIPVRAIIGQIAAKGGTTDPEAITVEVIASVARGYDISVDAVRAAIRFYERNRWFIDAWLIENDAVVNEEWLKANDPAAR